MMLFLTMILPEIGCSGLKRLRFLRKVCQWHFFHKLWQMALFPDSRLQDLEKEHNGQSKDNIVKKGKSRNLR